jgi:hypothetical protein
MSTWLNTTIDQVRSELTDLICQSEEYHRITELLHEKYPPNEQDDYPDAYWDDFNPAFEKLVVEVVCGCRKLTYYTPPKERWVGRCYMWNNRTQDHTDPVLFYGLSEEVVSNWRAFNKDYCKRSSQFKVVEYAQPHLCGVFEYQV